MSVADIVNIILLWLLVGTYLFVGGSIMRKFDWVFLVLWAALCIITILSENYEQYFIWSLGFIIGYSRAKGRRDD